MAINAYSTAELIGVQSRLFPPNSYWLDLAFPESHFSTTETIDLDKVVGNRRMAPLVMPNVPGKPGRPSGYSTARFRPAYVKPKDAVTPDRGLKRRAGEQYLGTETPMQRINAIVTSILQEQKDQIHRRWEWLAARAVIDASVVLEAQDYPSVTVDFQRDASQTITLSGTDLWTDTTNSDPLGDIEEWRTAVFQKTGKFINRLTMAPNVYKAFAAHPKVKDQLDTTVRGTSTSLNTSGGNGDFAQYKGTLGADLDIWVYNDVYEDNSGTQVPYMAADLVVGTGPGIQGVRAYGAIMDMDAQLNAMDIFPKMWKEQDPSAMFIMSQSAPLMVPMYHASFKAKVI